MAARERRSSRELKQMLELGIDEEAARTALSATGNDVQRAMLMILEAAELQRSLAGGGPVPGAEGEDETREISEEETSDRHADEKAEDMEGADNATEPAEHAAHEETPHKDIEQREEEEEDIEDVEDIEDIEGIDEPGLITSRKMVAEQGLFGRLVNVYLSADDQKMVDGLSRILKVALKPARGDKLGGRGDRNWDVRCDTFAMAAPFCAPGSTHR